MAAFALAFGAQDPTQLVLARMFQGLTAAAMVPPDPALMAKAESFVTT